MVLSLFILQSYTQTLAGYHVGLTLDQLWTNCKDVPHDLMMKHKLPNDCSVSSSEAWFWQSNAGIIVGIILILARAKSVTQIHETILIANCDTTTDLIKSE